MFIFYVRSCRTGQQERVDVVKAGTDLGTDQTRTLHPGDALLFNQPRDSFRVQADPLSATPLKILYIGFFGNSTTLMVDEIRSGDPVFHLSAQMQGFESFLTRLKNPGWQHRRLDAQSSAQAVWDLLAACAKSRQQDSSDDLCVTAAMDFMHQHIDRASVALTADHLGLSRMQLNRSFQQALQIPPGTWLRQQRLSLAKKQLRMDNTPISDIARNCGFSSATAFIATFKQHVNQTPHQWRKRQHAIKE
jgi:AraC-like DNA-binding protein